MRAPRGAAALLAALLVMLVGCGQDVSTGVRRGAAPQVRLLARLGEEPKLPGSVSAAVATPEGGYWILGRFGELMEIDARGNRLRQVDLNGVIPRTDQDTRRPVGLGRGADGALVVLDEDEIVRISADLTQFGVTTLVPPDGRPTRLTGEVQIGIEGAIFAIDSERRVLRIESNGEMAQIGRRCADDCGYEDPIALAPAGDGSLYILDGALNRVVQLGADGGWIRTIPLAPSGPVFPWTSRSLALGSSGDLFVLVGSGVVLRYGADGELRQTLQLARVADSEPYRLIGPPGALPHGGIIALSRGRSWSLDRFTLSGEMEFRIAAHPGYGPSISRAIDQITSPTGWHYIRSQDTGGILVFDPGGVYRTEIPRTGIGSLQEACVDREGRLLTVSNGRDALLRIDPWSGRTDTLRAVVLGYREYVYSMAVLSDGSLAMVIGGGSQSGVRLDLVSRLGAPLWSRELPLLVYPGWDPAGATAEVVRLRVDGRDRLWLLNQTAGQILQYDAQGERIRTVVVPREGVEAVRFPGDLALEGDDLILLSNDVNGKIHRFTRDMQFIDRFAPGSAAEPSNNCAVDRLDVDDRGIMTVLACGVVSTYSR